MRYRLEKLNQVQFADDEIRRRELEAKGFQLVDAKVPAVPDKEPAEGAAGENAAAEESGEAEEAKPAKKPAKKVKAAKGEEKDAG